MAIRLSPSQLINQSQDRRRRLRCGDCRWGVDAGDRRWWSTTVDIGQGGGARPSCEWAGQLGKAEQGFTRATEGGAGESVKACGGIFAVAGRRPITRGWRVGQGSATAAGGKRTAEANWGRRAGDWGCLGEFREGGEG